MSKSKKAALAAKSKIIQQSAEQEPPRSKKLQKAEKRRVRLHDAEVAVIRIGQQQHLPAFHEFMRDLNTVRAARKELRGSRDFEALMNLYLAFKGLTSKKKIDRVNRLRGTLAKIGHKIDAKVARKKANTEAPLAPPPPQSPNT